VQVTEQRYAFLDMWKVAQEVAAQTGTVGSARAQEKLSLRRVQSLSAGTKVGTGAMVQSRKANDF
jgi:hypothetical protein